MSAILPCACKSSMAATRSIALQTRALAGRVQFGQHGLGWPAFAWRRDRPHVPAVRPPVAQPENAGLGVGRIVHGVGELPLLTAMEHAALDRQLKADGAFVKAARHPIVGEGASVAHGPAEFGN